MAQQQKLLLDHSVYAAAPDYLFRARDWPQQRGTAGAGRGTTTFVADDNGEFALRHYYRGGMVARLLSDRYLARGAARSRGFLEWRLLQRLVALGLPVPQPIAARYVRHGLWYRADLLTRRIADVATLAESLAQAPLKEAAWQSLGATLRRFHDAGVFHADLNAHNLLINGAGDWFVLDFDRGEMRAPGDWQRSNLERLQRSLRKLSGENAAFAFSAADWLALLDGYSSASLARSA
ncbi:MAG: 3-deoxy-D-manno-octulosonic acid kinase [Pseudomonadota bacterium]